MGSNPVWSILPLKQFMFQSLGFEPREAPAGDKRQTKWVLGIWTGTRRLSEEVTYVLKVYKACLVFPYKY